MAKFDILLSLILLVGYALAALLTITLPPAKMSNEKIQEHVDVQAVKELLRTRYEDVYELNEDGTRYKKPPSLYNTPVAKITEDDDLYWNRHWLSLDSYLAKEDQEVDAKGKYHEMKLRDPGNKKVCEEAKRHQDNVSKHRKIREIFGGDEPRHPNQLVAKRYLPDLGLCEQEIMYHLGCKVSDFQYLHLQGLMGMEPWDFIRWRVGKLMLEKLDHPRLGVNANVRGVISNIISRTSEDPLFRQAILYSAMLSNRRNSYGPKNKNQGSYLVNGVCVIPGGSTGGATAGTIRRPPSAPAVARAASSSSRSAEAQRRSEEEQREKARQERRAERKRKFNDRTPSWQGINVDRQTKRSNSK